MVVRSIGWGGQRFAESFLGWCRNTIAKGEKELISGVDFEDRLSERGRKSAQFHLPLLLVHITEIVAPYTQADPTFRSSRLYTPLTAAEVRKRLLEKKEYSKLELPCERTIRNKLHLLGFVPTKVAKCKPLKKIEQTDDIFDEVHRINAWADEDPTQLRISLDTKAVVKVGKFSRGGKSRQKQKALDHDFVAASNSEQLVPFGIFLPASKENFQWFATSKVTADFMADCLDAIFPELKKRYPQMKTLVINADNGPESSGRRKQWLKRLVDFADKNGIAVQLAYYPPYHSKYNPIERCWGVLENHWRGQLLESVEKTLGLARSMTYGGINPVVKLVRRIYKSGVTLTKEAMLEVEGRLSRKPGLEPWFITIEPQPDLV